MTPCTSQRVALGARSPYFDRSTLRLLSATERLIPLCSASSCVRLLKAPFRMASGRPTFDLLADEWLRPYDAQVDVPRHLRSGYVPRRQGSHRVFEESR